MKTLKLVFTCLVVYLYAKLCLGFLAILTNLVKDVGSLILFCPWTLVLITVMWLVTCFLCPDGNFCVVSSHIYSDRSNKKCVGIERMEWINSELSCFRICWCIEHRSSLQFSISNPVLPDHSTVSVFWRMIPAEVDTGWSSEQNSYINWFTNGSCRSER